MALTMAGLVDGLTGLSWSGITKVFGEMPQQVTTANIPYMYPRIPASSAAAATFSAAIGLRSATVELVTVVGTPSQGTNAAKFDKMVALIDSMHAVLAANALTLNIDQWTIGSEYTEDGYWLIVATVEASG